MCNTMLLYHIYFSHQDEFACQLEGIRVITELMVHLCSHQTRNSNAGNRSEVEGTLLARKEQIVH